MMEIVPILQIAVDIGGAVVIIIMFVIFYLIVWLPYTIFTPIIIFTSFVYWLSAVMWLVIGVCIDTNVIYQSVLEKKTYWSYVSQKK